MKSEEEVNKETLEVIDLFNEMEKKLSKLENKDHPFFTLVRLVLIGGKTMSKDELNTYFLLLHECVCKFNMYTRKFSVPTQEEDEKRKEESKEA